MQVINILDLFIHLGYVGTAKKCTVDAGVPHHPRPGRGVYPYGGVTPNRGTEAGQRGPHSANKASHLKHIADSWNRRRGTGMLD